MKVHKVVVPRRGQREDEKKKRENRQLLKPVDRPRYKKEEHKKGE